MYTGIFKKKKKKFVPLFGDEKDCGMLYSGFWR